MKKSIVILTGILCPVLLFGQSESALLDFQYTDEARCHFQFQNDEKTYPVLPLLISSLNHENEQLVYSAVEEALLRKCDLNETHNQLNALNTAILLKAPKIVELLLKNKADIQLKINAPDKIFHQMNSLEFTDLLIEKRPTEPIYLEIKALLEKNKPWVFLLFYWPFKII